MRNGCLNLGRCVHDQTGCINNDGKNECLAEKWLKFDDAMPLVAKPTISYLKKRLESAHYCFGVTHRLVRKSIVGTHYIVQVHDMGLPYLFEVVTRNGRLWIRELEKEDDAL